MEGIDWDQIIAQAKKRKEAEQAELGKDRSGLAAKLRDVLRQAGKTDEEASAIKDQLLSQTDKALENMDVQGAYEAGARPQLEVEIGEGQVEPGIRFGEGRVQRMNIGEGQVESPEKARRRQLLQHIMKKRMAR